MLTTPGRGDDAFVQIEKARGIAPLSRIVLQIKRAIQILRRETDDIISITGQIAALEDNKKLALRDLSIAYERTGDYARATETAEDKIRADARFQEILRKMNLQS